MPCNPKILRTAFISSLILVSFIGFGLWIEYSLARPFFDSVFNGTSSFDSLNEWVLRHHEQAPGIRTLNFYLERRVGAAFRLFYLVGLFAWMGGITVAFRKWTLPSIRSFWLDPEPPVNLSVFRIAVFATFYWLLGREYEQILFFSSLPDELIFPPKGLGGWVAALPRQESLTEILWLIARVCCVTAMVGLWTRTSAFIVMVLGFYLLGILQIFGKVNHYHHLIWFSTIIALGPAAKVLSIDGIRSAWKRADRGSIALPSPSLVYALPLRLVLVLFGLLYFFPGFWKWILGGSAWIFSNNLQYHLYNKWSEFDFWTPILPFDQYHWFLVAGALGTVVFEMGVLFAVIFRGARPWAGVAGLMFHNMTALTMRISFWTLQSVYVVFLNWHAIFSWIGKRLFHEKLYVLYDGNCKMCRRTAATLAVFDVFQRIEYVNALDLEARKHFGLSGLDTETLLKDMYAVSGDRRWSGYDAYRVIARRIPVLWLALPFLYLWPIPMIGRWIYRRVADSRLCSISYAPLQPQFVVKPTGRNHALIIFGCIAVMMVGWFGITRQINAWPFACYPTFDGVLFTPVRGIIEVQAIQADGEVIPWSEAVIKQKFSPERYRGLMRAVLGVKRADIQNRSLKSFWSVLIKVNPSLEKAVTVQFYRVQLSTDPLDHENRIIDKTLLLEFQPDDPAKKIAELSQSGNP